MSVSETSATPPATRRWQGVPSVPGWAFWVVLLGVTWAASHYAMDIYKALDARWIIRFPPR